MTKMDKFFHTLASKQGYVIAIFVIPLLLSVWGGISIKWFVNNYNVHNDIIISFLTKMAALLFFNLILSFIGLTLYFCLRNRIKEIINQTYKKH